MPRKYKPKEGVKKRVPPDPEKVKEAVEAVKAGGAYKTCALLYGLNVMTLKRLCRKDSSQLPGYRASQVFSDALENELGSYLVTMSNMYYGLTRMQLRKLAYSFAKMNGLRCPQSWEKDEAAGHDWYLGFLERNSHFSLRTPEPTSLSRSTAFNRHTVGEFFKKLTETYQKHSFPPECVWNVDETGLTTVHRPSKVIAVKGIKQVGKMTSAERGELVTVCAAVSASGNHIPPFMIFPRVNWQPRMLNGAPPGSDGIPHPSGWMTGPNFMKFLKHFARFVQPTVSRKNLLILDNHESHIQIEAINFCRENGIVLLTIPPHTSHKLQPLDRTVFGPLKTYYNQAAASWMLMHPARTITIYEIGKVLEAVDGATYRISFLRRIGLSGGFSFPTVEDISEVDRGDIVKVLPQPSMEGTTRTAGILKFRKKFDQNVN